MLADGIDDQQLRETFLSRASVLLPRTRPETKARAAAREQFGGLTEREREVASLIAAGRSNIAIGQALVISERTVETHVTNILTKLNFQSRAQVAAWATEKGIGKQAT
jgi:DNA-binding NarL/FixJ family response regulator